MKSVWDWLYKAVDAACMVFDVIKKWIKPPESRQ